MIINWVIFGAIVLMSFWLGLVFGSRRKSATKSPQGTVLDTSALLDGRLQNLIHRQIVHPPYLLPSRVLAEIQEFQKSTAKKYEEQRVKANRALMQLSDSTIETDSGFNDVDADEQVVLQAIQHGYSLVTLDKEVEHAAYEKGVHVVNPDSVLRAVRPLHSNGEAVDVQLIAKKTTKNAYGITNHGELVVVKNGTKFVGKKKSVRLTNIESKGQKRTLEGELED